MSAIGETTGKLDIGRVIRELFSVLGRNFQTFAILAVLLTGIPTAVIYGLQTNAVANAANGNFGAGFFSSFLGGIFSLMTGLILQGTIIYGAVNDLNGRKVSVADSLRIGLNVFLPLLLIAILMGLAIGLGMVLLIVPGVMLAVAWCVAVPAFVVERCAVMDVFGRSAQLTRGNRWPIFGLFVIYIIIVLIIELVLGVFGGLTNLATFGGFPVITRLIVLPLINVAGALIGATGAAVLYVELRRVREGVGPEGLAAIFD
jgi:hypothetical protein